MHVVGKGLFTVLDGLNVVAEKVTDGFCMLADVFILTPYYILEFEVEEVFDTIGEWWEFQFGEL